MNHNNFSNENEFDRRNRLLAIQNRLNDFSTELNLQTDLVNWASTAFSNYETISDEHRSAKSNVKFSNTQLRIANSKLLKSYQKCKNMLRAYFLNDNKKIVLGIDGATPQKHNDLVSAAEIMIKGVNDLQSQGYDNILQDVFKVELQNALAECVEKFYKIGIAEEQYLEIRKNYFEHFKNDTNSLRIIYNIAISHWDRTYPDLVLIGFAFDENKRGRKKKRSKKEDLPVD